MHMPSAEDNIWVCTRCGIAGHDFTECFRRVPSQTKEHSEKLTELDRKIESEIAPLKKALDGVGDLKIQVGSLSDRVAALESWKDQAIPHLDVMQKRTSDFQDMLRDFPDWKKKIESSQKRQLSRFDAFLEKEWKPLKFNFETLLDEQVREKRQRSDSDDIIVQSDDEAHLDDARNDNIALPMADDSVGRLPPETPKKSKKHRSEPSRLEPSRAEQSKPGPDAPWLDIPPQSVGDAAWTEELLDALMDDWQPEYHDRLSRWLQVHSTQEMVETVQGLVSAETIRVRNGGLKTVLKGARVNPLVFSNKPRHR